jgi:hypothetical protein
MRLFGGAETPYFTEKKPQRASQGKRELKDIAVRRSALNFVTADERKADPFHNAGCSGRDDSNCQITKDNKFLSWV